MQVEHRIIGAIVSVYLELKEDLEPDVVLGFGWFSEIAAHEDVLSCECVGCMSVRICWLTCM